MALLYDPAALDLSDSAVADRLRKQAKTRAVKLLREAVAEEGARLTKAALRGHEGACLPSQVLDRALARRQAPLVGHASSNKYVAFCARNKTPASPHASPSLPLPLAGRSPSLLSLSDPLSRNACPPQQGPTRRPHAALQPPGPTRQHQPQRLPAVERGSDGAAACGSALSVACGARMLDAAARDSHALIDVEAASWGSRGVGKWNDEDSGDAKRRKGAQGGVVCNDAGRGRRVGEDVGREEGGRAGDLRARRKTEVSTRKTEVSTSPPPLRFWQSREGTAASATEADEQSSAMADAMLLLACVRAQGVRCQDEQLSQDA